MLTELRIRNFALIEEVTLLFSAGESVVTGETGSGKSLFVAALDFIRGARSDRRVLREGMATEVEATFSLPDDPIIASLLSSLDIETEENGLIIRRTLTESGSRQRVNDVSVTLQTLRALADRLLDIHAQNAQSLLKNPKTYLPLLDTYIGPAAQTQKNELHSLLSQRRKWEKERAAMELSPEELAREKDLLQFQIKEIAEADLPSIEEEELALEYKTLTSATDRLSSAQQLYEALAGSHGGLKYAMQSVASAFDDLARRDDAVKEMQEMMWQMDAEMETVVHELRHYQDQVRVDPERIHELDSLFQLLQTLKRKYGQSIEEILDFHAKAVERLTLLSHLEQARQKLDQKLLENKKQMQRVANTLHTQRLDAAEKLKKRVQEEMLQMAILQMEFDIPFRQLSDIGPDGYDAVDFYLSTNPGEPMQPLSEVASGGEMSRFMLALKIVASEIAAMPTLVFDEIDTGISGRTAQVVAEKLSRLSRFHQVLVITHLPQIAALADQHYRIRKKAEEEHTFSVVEPLDEAGREEEQARLIGGAQITEITRKSAAEMLQQAEAIRKAKGRA